MVGVTLRGYEIMLTLNFTSQISHLENSNIEILSLSSSTDNCTRTTYILKP